EAVKFRQGETGIVFKDIFISQVKKLNPFLTEDLAQDIYNNLLKIPPKIEGNLILWEYLKGLKTVFIPSEKREKNVKIIEPDDIDKNIFQVTEEFTFANGIKKIRADIVFFINGVPLILVETKAAHKIDGLNEALEQIKRYHKDCPEFFSFLQIYGITHLINFYYSASWNTSLKALFCWKEEMGKDFEMAVKTFFERKKILKLILDCILFTKKDDEIRKVILRNHQIRAVDKILERTGTDKKRGLVWHTQGSGKTYTMIVVAQKLIKNPIFESPTVIMLVDRNELESQLFGNVLSTGTKPIVAKSKEHLKSLLKDDVRGLIISMIHKFEGMPQDINKRNNIFVLVDEAHRTTGGILGNYLMGALPNATFIGFTGTPIDKTLYGKGTFVTFGKDDPPKGYLDKYNIEESIEDGTTVPLHYSLAPNELLVDRATLEREFLELAEAQGISDVEELNKILDKAVNLKNFLKSSDRIEKVSKYISDHFKNYVEPMGYKAFVVAVDREGCALYKKELDKYLPPDYSKVVYSPFYNDLPELQKYHLSEEEEKRVRKAFTNPKELPKILIVTEKLLTGFDAPVLYCMYLDKPMRDHVLLQAIARVNRPYEDEEGRKKPCGFVLDFVGIFENLEKALSFDSKDIEGVVRDINFLKERFADFMKRAREDYLNLLTNLTETKKVEKILEYFLDEEKRHNFYKFFKELSDMYEVISPDEFLRGYFEDFDTIVRMYKILREAYEPKILIEKEFTKKVINLV
ncbi:MAG: HsdR family type I site-specific deoxyribonuclease, partial [Thermoanaerobaculia bacterium]